MSLIPLGAALIVLMVDSAIELAMISSMVGYLHRSGANEYPFRTTDGGIAVINAKPKHLGTNAGHTSNGAAGTALVLICFGGFLNLWYQKRRERMAKPGPSKIFLGYTIFTILSVCLTISALAFTFAVGNQTKGQTIDTLVAVANQHRGYPLDNWVPGTWTKALLKLPLTSSKDVSYLRKWLRVMEGWEYNLIPMFVIGLVVAGLSVKTYLDQRRMASRPSKV
ncbi:hypothetical protein BGZ60DRAFT_259942 [Tricladium varicosporioides]|nr:hypothetical protein BGZ60DRAFT_259942 [Hymenoscyphus varicosporioides]